MAQINTNLQAQNIHKSLRAAEKKITETSQRVASGERHTKVSDGAAELSTGIGLKTDMSTYNTNYTSTIQARAVLGMSDGAYKEISNISQRLKSLSVQANAGSYSSLERSYIDLEAQKLTDEIDRLAGSTNFNGIKLINGDLNSAGASGSNVQGTDAKSSAKITFAAGGTNVVAGSLVVNGVTFDFDATANEAVTGTSIVVDKGLTAAQKAQKVADIINNATVSLNSVSTANPQGSMTQANRDALSDLVATVSGSSITITSKRAGGPSFAVTAGGDANSTDHITTVEAGDKSITVGATADTLSSSFSSGTKTGSLGRMNVSVIGTLGNATVQSLSQTKATTGWTTVASNQLDDGDSLVIFGRTFTLKNEVTNEQTQIKRSTSSNLETLQNIAQFLNNSEDPNIANYQFEVQQSGANNQIKITAKAATTTLNNAEVSIGDTAIEFSGGTAGVANGLDVSKITDNDKFLGRIDGFKATMTGTDRVKLSVKVGDFTYSGEVLNTAPTSNTKIRLKSDDLNGKGGSFDITIAANQGVSVASQTNADTFASKVNDAVKELSFYQNRKLENFVAKGTSIEGTTVTMTAKNFDTVGVSKIDTAFNKNTQEGSLSITLKDGRVFENVSDINEKVTKGQLIELSNKADVNEKISFIWGKDVAFSDATSLAIFTEDMTQAFQTNAGGMDFQVGLKADQVITVQLGDATTKALFDGNKIDLTTKEGAIKSGEVIDVAINKLKTYRANVGALQSRFDSAAANIETSIQNTDAARSVFLDADIPTESTNLALAQVLMQANVSVLAQMNTLPQNLLKLVG